MKDTHKYESKDEKGQDSVCFGALNNWDFDWETFKDADQDIQKLFDDSVNQYLEAIGTKPAALPPAAPHRSLQTPYKIHSAS